ncbi:hypothetical protein [Persicitalea jodogahamensis]|uniref:Outer membrane protein beta-barrel domain-containing protein n=1 Tax=Persicitalea jodogahamensis TaxID=402147 RepID=A0A8J3D736_9BACT|nr:hypothetical protein [Persicitalea jodogahamensis]GHB54948.1 hypothetical protein GCM10007390_05090 [Persicitalea jodogahamensis]
MRLQKKFIRPVFLLKAALWTFMLMPLSVAAQQRNLVSFSGGYSLPVGQFASENLNDPEAGLAGSGIYGQLNYERKLLSWLGLRLTGNLNINQTDAQPLIDRFSPLLDKSESYSWKKETTTWQLGALLLGPSGYLTRGSIELEGHVQGGLIFVESPGVKVLGTSSEGGPTVEGQIKKASTNAFGFGAGASVRFRLTDWLRFQITADGIGSNAQLKNVQNTGIINNVVVQNVTSNPKRFVSVVNVGAGLVFGF